MLQHREMSEVSVGGRECNGRDELLCSGLRCFGGVDEYWLGLSRSILCLLGRQRARQVAARPTKGAALPPRRLSPSSLICSSAFSTSMEPSYTYISPSNTLYPSLTPEQSEEAR